MKYNYLSHISSMPSTTRRIARATKLVRLYIRHQRARHKRLTRRIIFLKQSAALHTLVPPLHLDPLSELSSAAPNSNKNSSGNESSEDSSMWSSSGAWLSDNNWDSESEDEMPVPLELENDRWDDGDDNGEGGISDGDADDERSDDEAGFSTPPLRRWVRNEIDKMYAHRYEVPRNKLPRGPPYMHHVLTTQKDLRPDHFRQSLRVSPMTFDKILAKISDDPVFFNNSNNPQQPVEEQLAIALYRFGHNGNAAGLQKVANWAGTGKGTVTSATRRVMTAVLRPGFMQEAVRLPTTEEKEEAKAWVEKRSCEAWRNGWCLVDGTLVPLYTRPYWFGKSYFDRKCNYSLNIQVSCLLPSFDIWDNHETIDCFLAKPPHHRFQLWSHRKYT